MTRAAALSSSGDADGALGAYERALTLRPDASEALWKKGKLYESCGKKMMALAEYETLVGILPNDLSAHEKLVSMYHDLHMIKEHNDEVRRFKAIVDSKKEQAVHSGTMS